MDGSKKTRHWYNLMHIILNGMGVKIHRPVVQDASDRAIAVQQQTSNFSAIMARTSYVLMSVTKAIISWIFIV